MTGWGSIFTFAISMGAFCVSGCSRADLFAVTDSESAVKTTDASTSPCKEPALPAGDSSLHLQVGNLDRTYVLHVPTRYDGTEPVPLIIDLHGIGGTGWGELSSSTFPAVTDAEGVVMAFPDGTVGPIGTTWNMGPCCVEGIDDLGFIKALVATIRKDACIDPKRIYAVGILTGGGMVIDLACAAADVFAAVSPSAFDLTQEMLSTCKMSRPVSAITFRGTADTHVPYTGGPSILVSGMPMTFLGAQASFEKWAQLNGCTGTASPVDSNGCSAYSNCTEGSEVVLCTKQGAAAEPADATLAWPVLKRHSLE